MAQNLQRGNKDLPFVGGLSLKVDPLQVDAAQVLALVNATFQTPKRLSLRNGVEQVGPALTGAQMLTTFNGASSISSAPVSEYLGTQELINSDGTDLWSLNEGLDVWVNKGRLASAYCTQQQVCRDSLEHKNQSGATDLTTGLQCYSWTNYDYQGFSIGVSYSIIDGNTGQILVAPTSINPSGQNSKVYVWQSQFVIIYYNTTTERLDAAVISIASPQAAPVINHITAPPGTSSTQSLIPANGIVWDAVTTWVNDSVNGVTNMLTVGFSNFGGTFTLNTYAFNNFVAPSQTGSPGILATNTYWSGFGFCAFTAPSTQAAPLPNTGTAAYWYYDENALNFGYSTQEINVLSSAPSPESFVISNGESLRAAVGIYNGTNSQMFWGIEQSGGVINYYTQYAEVNLNENASGTSILWRSVTPCGKPFYIGGQTYLPLLFGSTVQPTYFIGDSNGNLNARFNIANAGAYQDWTPENTVINSSTVRIPLLIQTEIDSFNPSTVSGTNAAQLFGVTGVCAETINFADPAFSYLHAELGGNVLFSGGMPSIYDGAAVVEQGFNVFPESITGTANIGEYVYVYVYQYVVTYEWYDAQGNIHRSAQSIPLTQGFTEGDGPISPTNTITLTIPTLRLTQKENVQIVVYRTQANLPNFQRVYSTLNSGNSPQNPIINSTTEDTITFIDNVADATLASNPYIYTTGGVVNNSPLPPCASLCVHYNRIFAVLTDTPLTVWFSEQVIPTQGVGVSFSNVLLLPQDPRGGAVTAVAVLEAGLLVFKQYTQFVLQGVGPDSTNNNNDFQDPWQITTDAGCVNPRSVQVTPNGVVFQSAKGIYQCDKGLNVTYIGAPVEGLLNPPGQSAVTITSCVQIANTNQIRWTLQTGITVVWDYYVNQWSTFSPMNAVDTCIWQGEFCYFNPVTFTVWQETPGVYVDPGNEPISMSVQLAWLWLAGLQGFSRIWEFLVMGTYGSPLTCNIQLAYDGDPSIQQNDYIDVPAPNSYGGPAGGTYGANSTGGVYGGAPFGSLLQFRVFPAIQQCESMQINLQITPTEPGGSGMTLNNINVSYGARQKGWTPRAGSAAQYG